MSNNNPINYRENAEGAVPCNQHGHFKQKTPGKYRGLPSPQSGTDQGIILGRILQFVAGHFLFSRFEEEQVAHLIHFIFRFTVFQDHSTVNFTG